MKPTVIPSGNISNRNNSQGINNMNIPAGNVSQDPNNISAGGNNTQTNNTRRPFPSYQQGFGFDPDIDDIFSDTGMRSRLPGRMRDPFTSFSTHDTDNFFPGFGQMGSGRRNRTNPQNIGDDGFFSSFPDEFRQYIPEGFGFGRRGGDGTRPTVGSPTGNNINNSPQQYYQQPPQQQYYQQPNQYNNVAYDEQGAPPAPQLSKPQLCDAAIQTEDLLAESQDTFPIGVGTKLQQHGLRNTVDMGQKSVQEEENRGPRSHSAPPNNKDGQFSNKLQQSEQQPEQLPGTKPVYMTSATVMTAAPKKIQIPVRSQGSQEQQPYYTSSLPNPPHRHSSIPPEQQPPPQTPTTPGGSYIRTVPIFVEGRQSPVINSHKEIPNQYHQAQQSLRPTVNTATANISDDSNQAVPPQTPHTTDCINKITDIQRDVLDLMSKVENFKGQKNDKEYMYLDEMLTRNLLKLDTIDTNGKESIRLARKEAIKCIQASINVLEAKSGENARAAANVVNTTSEKELNKQQKNDNSSKTKINVEENPNLLNEQIVIPLPPPPEHEPEHEPEHKVIEENPNILDEETVIALPPPPQLQEAKSEEECVDESKKTETVQSVESLEENNISKLDKCTPKGESVAIGEPNLKESSPLKEGAKKKIIKKLKKNTNKEKEASHSATDAEPKMEE